MGKMKWGTLARRSCCCINKVDRPGRLGSWEADGRARVAGVHGSSQHVGSVIK